MTADCSGWWLLKIEGLWKFLKVRQQWSLPHQQASFHKWFIRSIQSSFITFNPQLNFFQNWSQSSLTLPLPYQLRLHFSSVAQSCPPLCYPMDCSTPGFPVHHNSRSLIKLMSSRWAIQPSHPLPSPSPPAFNLSQHQGLFQGVSSSHQVARVLEFQLQHHFFQWIFRTDFL